MKLIHTILKQFILFICICILNGNHAHAQFWSLTGNAGTSAGTNFLGTTDNTGLKIRTNNSVRMNISNSGKIAIGNFSPIFKLDVKNGSINTDSLYRISGIEVLSRNVANQIQLGDATANIGIGTSVPSQKLEVSGIIYSTSGGFKFPDGTVQVTALVAGANAQLSNLGTTAVNAHIIPATTGVVSLGSLTKRWNSIYSTSLEVKGTNGVAATFDGGSQTYMRWQENGAARGYIGSFTGNAEDVDFGTSSGNVLGNVHLTLQGTMKEFTLASYGEIGIGTTSPEGKLHIYHNSSINDPQLNLYESENDFARINFGNATTGDFWSIAGSPAFTNSDARLNFYNSVTGNLMSLTGGGSVCIGTSTPASGYKLCVAGKAICTEMKVQPQASWPDYVFDDDYTLPSLNELKSYIDKNNHLPGIPSAEEIASDKGFEMGAMQVILVKKIEELSLYLLQQNKDLNLLKAENEKMQMRFKAIVR